MIACKLSNPRCNNLLRLGHSAKRNRRSRPSLHLDPHHPNQSYQKALKFRRMKKRIGSSSGISTMGSWRDECYEQRNELPEKGRSSDNNRRVVKQSEELRETRREGSIEISKCHGRLSDKKSEDDGNFSWRWKTRSGKG